MAGLWILLSLLSLGSFFLEEVETRAYNERSNWLRHHDIYHEKRTGDRCEPMTNTMCKEVGYNQTTFPNMLGHETQDDASLEVHQFYPLVKVECSPYLRHFICTVYLPVCISYIDRDLLPCRRVCEAAKNGCETLMNRFGFMWPEKLECNQFPEGGSCLDSIGYGATALEPTTPETGTPEPSIPEPSTPQPSNPEPSKPKLGSNITFEGDIHLKNCHCVCRP